MMRSKYEVSRAGLPPRQGKMWHPFTFSDDKHVLEADMLPQRRRWCARVCSVPFTGLLVEGGERDDSPWAASTFSNACFNFTSWLERSPRRQH